MENKITEIELIAAFLRKKVTDICINANAGHIGGCLGAVELLATAYFGNLIRLDITNPFNYQKDFVVIRGHLGPLRYAIFNLLEWLKDEELDGYRKFGTRLPGHEDYKKTPGVDFTPSGSLGMILSYICGAALECKIKNLNNRFIAFIGDGEEQEGNISEAARHISHLNLNNIIAIIDKNGKQLSNPTDFTDSASNLLEIWRGYGWHVIEIKNGHSIKEIFLGYEQALNISNKPVLIIANTIKGKGLEGCLEHFSGYHTVSVCKPEILLKSQNFDTFEPTKIKEIAIQNVSKVDSSCDKYFSTFVPIDLKIHPKKNTPNNPDDCQFDYLKLLSERWEQKNTLYFLSADTTTDYVVKKINLNSFCNYFNIGLREQHTVAMIHGISIFNKSSRIIFNTLDAFTYRWIDQLNAISQGKGNIIIIADCAGLTNSKNGSTHQTTSQPHAVFNIPNTIFLEPWNMYDMFRCLNWAIGYSRGIVFIRSGRYNVDIAHDFYSLNSESIPPKNYIIRNQAKADILIISSGVCLNEASVAADILEKEKIYIKIINVVNHSQINDIIQHIEIDIPIIIIYNGLASFITTNILRHIAISGINKIPKIYEIGFDIGQTGDLTSLLSFYKMDSKSIVDFCKNILINHNNDN